MKLLCMLLIASHLGLFRLTVGSPRIKRQVDGSFWWLTTISPVGGPSPLPGDDSFPSPPGIDVGGGSVGGIPNSVPGELFPSLPSNPGGTIPGSIPRPPGPSGIEPSPSDPFPPPPGPIPNIVGEAGLDSLSNREEGECDCVPYYLCKEGNIITDGEGLIDVRFGPYLNETSPRASHSKCENFLDVCCTVPGEDTRGPALDYSPKCGRRNVEGVHAKIVGFKEGQAQFGEFPWQTAILRTENLAGKELKLYVCGGSLIHPRVVLTAAHCVDQKRPDSLKIRMGEWDTQKDYEYYAHVDRYVQDVIVHSAYHPKTLYNDFALLILGEPVELQPHIDTLCLPPPGTTYPGTTCFATGWGKDKFGKEGIYQHVMKSIDLPIVAHRSCQDALRTTRLGQYFFLHDSFICAGGIPNKDTCKGDGGSPLACPFPDDPHTYFQAGIVAWGIGCGEQSIPGVYASVSYAVPWIRNELASRNIIID